MPPVSLPLMEGDRARGAGTWVVLPTYDEADNVGPITAAILLRAARGAHPRRRRRLARRHRAPRRRARRDRSAHPCPPPGGQAGSRAGVPRRVRASRSRAAHRSSSRWTPTSATIPAVLPALIAPVDDGSADLVIGSRYTAGGGVVDWGLGRRLISRGGRSSRGPSSACGPNDLTGGFKAWRASTLAAVPFDGVHAGGYVFQIEMTFRASRLGARIREVPITFRDRRVGQSKMSRRIVVEALVVVVQLRLEDLRGRCAADERAPGDAPSFGRTTERRRRPPGVRVVLDVRALQEPTARRHRRLPRGAAGGVRRRPARRRVVRLPAASPTSTTRRRGSTDLEVVGRRLLPPDRLLALGARMTVDPFLLRGASLGAAWRADRRWRGGRRLPRGRWRALPLASGLPIGRDAPRPRAVGAARRLPAHGRLALRAAAPRAAAARRRRGHRRDRCRRATRPAGCSISGAIGSGSSRSPRGMAFAPERPRRRSG